MTRRHTLAKLATMTAAAAVLLLQPGHSPTRPTGAVPPAAIPAAAAAHVPGAGHAHRPESSPAGTGSPRAAALPGSASAAAGAKPPIRSGPPAAPATPARLHAKPAPFVQPFAAQPGVRPLPARRSPTAPVRIPVNVDGCDRAYGTPTQCVPWTFPAGVTDKCAWLAAHGFGTLTVRGPDRHALDRNRNGTACD